MAKIRQSNLDNSIITGLTELSTVAADTDFMLVYDASSGSLKKIKRQNIRLNTPTVTSVSPTSVLSGDGTGNHTFTITGTNFVTGASAVLLTSGGGTVNFDTVTVDSATQITATIAKSSLPGGNDEPYDVKVTTSDGTDTIVDQINVDQQPIFVTASGSLGSIQEQTTGNFSVNAYDPESAGDVTFELQSGTLPPGFSITNTSSEGGTAVIGGTLTGDIVTSTDYNFTLRAVDAASNTSSRSFSITVTAFNVESFTSSGTFAVPSGITSVNVLAVGGGGNSGGWDGYHPDHSACGGQNGGGGAGGLIFMPCYPVTPGGTITVTIGCSAQNSSVGSPGDPGLSADVLTAVAGGGGGRAHVISAYRNGKPGGSGGGGSPGSPACGSATQPTQPGNSGAYGFGNPASKSGGGAGASGSPSSGGIGRAYTIADGCTPVYYAGGGGKTGAAGGNGGGGGPGADPGDANKGGGGGAGGASPGPDVGQGGKGIVIIQY